MKNLLEIREYKFEGCTILIKLDRQTKKASFVEWDSEVNEYTDKDWYFSGRELEFMNGWLNILNCMKYVIEDVKKEMESWDEEETDQLIKLFAALDKAEKKVK